MKILPINQQLINRIPELYSRNQLNITETQNSQPALQLSPADITKLLPPVKGDIFSNIYGKDVISVWDLIPQAIPSGAYFPLAEILANKYALSMMLFNFHTNAGGNVDSGLGYEKYLQFPNPALSALAYSIVDRSDSNDEKMYKIEQWVIANTEYVSDIKNYGQDEFWAYPTITVNKGKGDCEDGAFLTHSLGLHAGVPMDRIRTYGGLVETEEGLFILGGHGWTAYQRESDDEWVTLDWCYYPEDAPLYERIVMKDDMKYVDDFFFIEGFNTIDTSLINRIRRPMAGGIINIYA